MSRTGRAGGTPLCPAGHLPHKGGDRLGVTASPNNSATAPLPTRRKGNDGLTSCQSPPLWGSEGRVETRGSTPGPAGQRGVSRVRAYRPLSHDQPPHLPHRSPRQHPR
ncbi:hypothetical protein CO666_04840 [Rhizobium chutanense]|uniref:Lytic murein transglycosylase n=1 Tax=Rhizobium chutanense TaxID=2035448 RepID=A0A2A6JI40_9HYPH|nr:hypothetical protein CO666_04840 [Rhizobium chutanense]